MRADDLTTFAFCLAFTVVSVLLSREIVFALRNGYFRHSFIRNRMFRDVMRDGQPVLFWLGFVLNVLALLPFAGAAILFGWATISSWLGRS